MQNEEFFVKLESNVLRTYPDQVSNSIGNFVTHLAKKHTLNNTWECGLTEISYSKSWYNIDNEEVISFIDMDNKIHQSTVNLKPGYYDIEKLINEINNILKNISLTSESYKDNSSYILKSPLLTHDKIHNKIQIQVGIITAKTTKMAQPPIYVLPKFSYFLNNVLGLLDSQMRELSFNNIPSEYSILLARAKRDISINSQIEITGYTEIQLDSTFYSLFVYTNIIEPISVGNTYAQLLREVEIPSDKKFGDQVWLQYHTPYYIPLLFNEIDAIEIDIKNDFNTPINFSSGKTSLMLHFRKRKNGIYY